MVGSLHLHGPLLRSAVILAAISQFTVLAGPTRFVPDVDLSIRSIENPRLALRDDPSFSWYTSIGDSFSAGPSAGEQRTVDSDDYDCSRYDQAFPIQLSNSDQIGGSKTLQFLACTGAKMPQVVEKQLPLLSPRIDLITLTIGGNDVGFGSILNNCIYKIKPSTWSCQDTINWARTTWQSQQFADSYSNILQTIFEKVPTAHVYVLGYPTFFNPDDPQCSETCFKFGAPCSPDELLTPEWRSELNGLNTALNDVIKSIVLRNPPSNQNALMEFIDPNPGYNGHRFCEPGFNEPNYENPDCWFYPFTWYKRPWAAAQADSSICDNLDTPEAPYTGDLGTLIACGIAQNATLASLLDSKPELASTTYPDPGDGGGEVSIAAPAWAQRIFHPTINGMTSFMDDVIQAIKAPDPANIATASSTNTQTSDPTPTSTPTPTPTPEPTVNNLCNLGNYQDPTKGPINDGMDYLKGKRGEQFCVAAKECGRPSCSYGTGISVCNDKDEQICVDLGTIGDQAYTAQQACEVDTTCTSDELFCGTYDFEPCCSDTVKAFQAFETEGYNILVKGGFDC